MEPGTPYFDPSGEIMKSHRLVRSGGGAVLETDGTISFVLEYRIDFALNGSLQNWELVASAADPTDPTDPTGWVMAVDYNARTNNKH